MKTVFVEIKSLMDRADPSEERNSELKNKAGEVIQTAAKEGKTEQNNTEKKGYKSRRRERRFSLYQYSGRRD